MYKCDEIYKYIFVLFFITYKNIQNWNVVSAMVNLEISVNLLICFCDKNYMGKLQ